MKKVLTFIFCLVTLSLSAQLQTETFEEFNIGLDTFDNGSDGSGGFTTTNQVFLPNIFTSTPTFTSWSGWSISSKKDTVTAGFGNQHSCISGSGYNSDNYAVTFVSGESKIWMPPTTGAVHSNMVGFYINNTTYTYLSMLNGDSFAKKFGGATGDDPDYLLLTIKHYENGTLSTDSVDFYLADYRFTDNTQDYIIKDWTFVDLSSFGFADSLVFTMSSTDVGMFGMNTPAYFCMDDLQYNPNPISTRNQIVEPLDIFPNPTTTYFSIENLEIEEEQALLSIHDVTGKVVLERQLNKWESNFDIDISTLSIGIYIVKVGNQVAKLIKQ